MFFTPYLDSTAWSLRPLMIPWRQHQTEGMKFRETEGHVGTQREEFCWELANDIEASGAGADLLKHAFVGLHLNELFIFVLELVVSYKAKRSDTESSCYSFSGMFSHCDGEWSLRPHQGSGCHVHSFIICSITFFNYFQATFMGSHRVVILHFSHSHVFKSI